MLGDGYHAKYSANILLLVDDHEPNVLIASTLLNHFGYEFEVAENGAKAVELFQCRSYCLVLMDIQMPIMNGHEATTRIRQHELKNDSIRVPIIALSANSSISDQALCTACGMDDFLGKPYMPEQLSEKIKAHLDRAAARSFH